MKLSILGLGTCIPSGRLTNDEVVDKYLDDFCKYLNEEDREFLEYSFKRKLEFLEIQTRAYCESYNEENSILMAVKAAKMALEKAQLKAEDIDLLLFTGVCNPFREPTYAIILAELLNIPQVNCYDISDACNGFLKSLELAQLYVSGGKAEKVLVVTSESPFEYLDTVRDNLNVKAVEEADYKMNLLFAGTGAAAMVLSEGNGEKIISDYQEQRSTREWDISFLLSPKITIPSKKFNKMDFVSWGDGRKIAADVIKEMPDFVSSFLKKHEIKKQDIDYIFCHQLGRNITYAILNKIEVEINKVFPENTFRQYGNMGSANIPIGLAIAEEKGLLKKGDSILLLGSSCGIEYTAVHLIW